jgi:hypothetical protein
MCAVLRPTSRWVVAVLAGALLGGCSSGEPAPRATQPPAVPTLPPGDLRDRVLQPDEVTRALVPIAAQTGARDIHAIAAFSANPKDAEKSLQAHGFQSAYVVQYGDPTTSGVVTNVVTKFATASGATTDLTGDLAAAGGKNGTAFTVTGLGEQAGGIKGRLRPDAPDGTLVTLRWRAGDTTWLLAVGANKPVDATSVRALADRLMARLAKGSD